MLVELDELGVNPAPYPLPVDDVPPVAIPYGGVAPLVP